MTIFTAPNGNSKSMWGINVFRENVYMFVCVSYFFGTTTNYPKILTLAYTYSKKPDGKKRVIKSSFQVVGGLFYCYQLHQAARNVNLYKEIKLIDLFVDGDLWN